jgi:putative transposase
VLTEDGPLAIGVPRDRDGSCAPQLIGKHDRRLTGFDELYARGLTIREIQAFLKEMSASDVSSDLLSAVTDAIVAEVTAWQSRSVESVHAQLRKIIKTRGHFSNDDAVTKTIRR